jgi:hypothetical protein
LKPAGGGEAAASEESRNKVAEAVNNLVCEYLEQQLSAVSATFKGTSSKDFKVSGIDEVSKKLKKANCRVVQDMTRADMQAWRAEKEQGAAADSAAGGKRPRTQSPPPPLPALDAGSPSGQQSGGVFSWFRSS